MRVFHQPVQQLPFIHPTTSLFVPCPTEILRAHPELVEGSPRAGRTIYRDAVRSRALPAAIHPDRQIAPRMPKNDHPCGGTCGTTPTSSGCTGHLIPRRAVDISGRTKHPTSRHVALPLLLTPFCRPKFSALILSLAHLTTMHLARPPIQLWCEQAVRCEQTLAKPCTYGGAVT